MTDSESDQSFLGMVLATPFDLKREQTRAVTRSWAGHVDEALRPDGVMALLSNVWPDALGKRNLAGKVRAHLAKYGTAIPFEEVCPQHLNTLSGDDDVIVGANAAIGATEVDMWLGNRVVGEGRVVSFGQASKRLYQVVSVEQAATISHMDVTMLTTSSGHAPAGTQVRFTHSDTNARVSSTLFKAINAGDRVISIVRKTGLPDQSSGSPWYINIVGPSVVFQNPATRFRLIRNQRMTLDYPLVAAVSNGDAVNLTPTGRWLWTQDAVANPPDWSRGIVAGIGFLLDVVEAV